MKISIKQDFQFNKDSNIKIDNQWLSITEPGYCDINSQKTEVCGHQLILPKTLKEIFNPNDKNIISVLSIDNNKKKKLVSFTNHLK